MTGTPAAIATLRADGLVAEHAHGRGGRADEGDAGRLAGVDEIGVLAEEAVAGVDGVGAAHLRDADDLGDREVGGDRAEALADAVGLVGLEAVQRELVLLGEDRDRRLPISFAARMTRMAISPRLAIRILAKVGMRRAPRGGWLRGSVTANDVALQRRPGGVWRGCAHGDDSAWDGKGLRDAQVMHKVCTTRMPVLLHGWPW